MYFYILNILTRCDAFRLRRNFKLNSLLLLEGIEVFYSSPRVPQLLHQKCNGLVSPRYSVGVSLSAGKTNNVKMDGMFGTPQPAVTNQPPNILGVWTDEEDKLLMSLVKTYGKGSWDTKRMQMKTERSTSSLRLRWVALTTLAAAKTAVVSKRLAPASAKPAAADTEASLTAVDGGTAATGATTSTVQAESPNLPAKSPDDTNLTWYVVSKCDQNGVAESVAHILNKPATKPAQP